MKQIEAILTHLKTKGSITPLDALMNFETVKTFGAETRAVGAYNYRNGELRQQQFFTP